MLDLKALKSALSQLEEERGVNQEKILAAIEDALVAAYKKDYGKRDQIVRAKFDLDVGTTEFYQVKIVVDESMLKSDEEDEEAPIPSTDQVGTESRVPAPPAADVGKGEEADEKIRFNEEHHIMLDDAQKIKKDAQVKDELTFPLETRDDFGRIAAQTAKQVIIQRIREAEKTSILADYQDKEGQIINGKVQKIERGNVFVDLGRVTGLLAREEQIPGEYYRQGERIKAYLARVEETPRGVNLRLSRAHPDFVHQLFAIEAPEVANGTVEIKATAREAGSRTKIAVTSTDPNIDPVGSCVGQRGVRVNTVISELGGGEKIDIVEWIDDIEAFISNALSPAKINEVALNEVDKTATILVDPDQFSLAVGKGGQNARLAAKLSGWKIDIVSPEQENEKEEAPIPSTDQVDTEEDEPESEPEEKDESTEKIEENKD